MDSAGMALYCTDHVSWEILGSDMQKQGGFYNPPSESNL